MAKKRAKSPNPKKPSSSTRKAKPKAAGKVKAKPTARAPQASGPPARRPAATPGASASPAARDVRRAERLRDDIRRSKMTHPDPWGGYTAKARRWSDRADQLVAEAQAGGDVRRAVDTLASEVEGDRDFQEARRLF